MRGRASSADPRARGSGGRALGSPGWAWANGARLLRHLPVAMGACQHHRTLGAEEGRRLGRRPEGPSRGASTPDPQMSMGRPALSRLKAGVSRGVDGVTSAEVRRTL